MESIYSLTRYNLESSMDIASLLVSVITGAVGGNAAGAALKDKSLGTVGNSLAGVGGGLVTQLLPLITGGNVDAAALITSILGNNALAGDIGTSGIGGAIAMAAVAFIKQYLNKGTTVPPAAV